MRNQSVQEIPIGMVGGNKFGRYPKISQEQTFNFIISDDALVPYAAYKNVLAVQPTVPGRKIYSSARGQIMVAVWGSSVYSIKKVGANLQATFRGTLQTFTGDVYISENNSAQIAITDGSNATLYVFNWLTGIFTTEALPAAIKRPGYISFQNGRLILVDLDSNNWYLSDFNNALSGGWSTASNRVGSLQSKPDTIQAAVPTPGGGNNLLLFGHTVAEPWQDVGNALFPYQRNSTNNTDYGCLNASSIAALETFIVWLAANEQGGASLMVYSGGETKRISTDGIDFKLANLSNPTNCSGFLFRQDGHLIYQFTFPDDNLSYIYDFNTQLFCTVTDEYLNYHIAKEVVYFDNSYYFVSSKGGNLFQFGTQFTDADYGGDDIFELPRIRVPKPLRLPSQRMFILKSLGFTIENGQPNDITTIETIDVTGDALQTEGAIDLATEDGTIISDEAGTSVVTNTVTIASEAVDLSISRDGGESFGSSLRLNMNPIGKRRSRFVFQRLGQANDLTPQLRFTGFGRFVVFDGVYEVYQ